MARHEGTGWDAVPDPHDMELEKATARELIVLLAEVEDAQRRAAAADHGWPPELERREQAVVAELDRRGLAFRKRSGDILAKLMQNASPGTDSDAGADPAVVVVDRANVDPSKVVRLAGRVDAATGNALLHQLLAALTPDRNSLVIDLTNVVALDLAGAGILETVRRQAAMTGHDVRVIGASDEFLALLVNFAGANGPEARVPDHDGSRD